jgi:catechol 2,3-dioxygenase-like lactoylglutathione lyase family enzyme
MPLVSLDHVNIRTANLAAMSDFYEDVLGLEKGPRPPFRGFDGAWHYCAGKAAVHLVEVDRPADVKETQIEHFAFRGNELSVFLEKLRERKIAFQVAIIPDVEIRQVNIYDPDGNHIEIQFAATEKADISPYNG